MSTPPKQPRQDSANRQSNSPKQIPAAAEPTLDERVENALAAARAVQIPRIPEPGLWALAPWLGPAWETAYDLQEGDYGSAAMNAGLLAAEFTPIMPLTKTARVVRAINKTRRAPLLARAGTQTARIRKIEKVGKDYEVHHTIPMAGWGPIAAADRKAVGLARNHPAWLKVMDKATHRRLTGEWTDPVTGQVLPQFGPAMRAWHGTNALQKTGATAATAVAAKPVDTLVDAFGVPRRSR